MKSKMVEDGYLEFIARKWEHGRYASVIERLGQRARAQVYHAIVKLLLETTDYTQDREFMERVGDHLVRRQKRVDRNAD